MSNNPCQGEPGVQRSFQRLSTTPLFSSPVMDEAVDVADSWEDADAEELEMRMELRQRHSRGETVHSDESDFPRSQSVQASATQAPLRESEWEGTQYVPPVKILRRPEGGVATGASSVEPSCTSNEHKTFAQREAEYASARARILGSGSKDSSLTREGSRNIK